MKDFNYYMDAIGEFGFAEEILTSIVYASGLPTAKPNELVLFESGELGRIISLKSDRVEILVLSNSEIKVGTRMARTDEFLKIELGDNILGRMIDPIGNPLDDGPALQMPSNISREVDILPPPLSDRAIINESLETGVPLVDLIIPIGKGQRQLVIGDAKTGKTQFFIRTLLNHTKTGNICIYAAIGKKVVEVRQVLEAIKKRGIDKSTIVVASGASDSPGLIFITPYTAMTIAEYFKDKGYDVLVILDDLTNHAKYYRQISLLAGRFPGRNSYPGDIFYIHSKLMERAGKFKKGSITCFPVAESVMGDLSGYIQTNLMSMTDGHIFFDTDLSSLGRRPSINPFLSVTRVGQQAQTKLARDVSRELTSFLLSIETLKTFIHFGAELSEPVKQKLALSDRILGFFDQPTEVVPRNVSLFVIGLLWTGFWRDQGTPEMRSKIKALTDDYAKDAAFKSKVDKLISGSSVFNELIESLREGEYGQKNYI